MQGIVPQLQCHPKQKELHTSPIFFRLWRIPQAFSEYFTNKIITIRNSFPPLNPTVAMDKSGKLLDIYTSHWTICFGNSPEDCPQIMRSWSHSYRIAVRKPWCSPPYNHQHQHFIGFWFCTTRLQNCCCQIPAQKSLPRWKCTQKLLSNLKPAITV